MTFAWSVFYLFARNSWDTFAHAFHALSQTWGQILTLPFINCVTWDKWFSLSAHQFPCLEMAFTKTSLVCCDRGWGVCSKCLARGLRRVNLCLLCSFSGFLCGHLERTEGICLASAQTGEHLLHTNASRHKSHLPCYLLDLFSLTWAVLATPACFRVYPPLPGL